MSTALVRPEVSATIGPVAPPVIVVPAQDVPHPAATVLAEGFETTVGGFVAGSGSSVSRVSGAGLPHTGTSVLDIARSATVGVGTATRTLSALVVGASYTTEMWLRRFGTAITDAKIGVTGKGTTAGITLTTSWVKLSYSFTATATTHEFLVSANLAGTGSGNGVLCDDLAVIRDAWVEHVPPVTSAYPAIPVSEGRITLDENYAPYAMATVEVPLTDLELLERIDPRDDQRVAIVATEQIGGTARDFDLGLRSRTVDHKSGVVTLELASDEALLIDRRNLSATVDNTPRSYEASLRAVCGWALGKIGATLAPGTADADVTARWRAENAILNPNVVNLTGYLQAGNLTLSHSATANAGVEGTTGYLIGVSAAAGQAFVSAPQSVSARKGQMWTFSAYMHKANGIAATLNGILRVYEQDSAGNVIRQIESTPKALPSSGGAVPYTWDRHVLTFTVENPNTTKLMVYGSFMATAAGQAVGMDGFMLTEGPLVLPFFSGSTTPTGYVTAWTGQPVTANNSVSVRAPADGVERLPELFGWKPGQSLSDFLRPLLEASGLRLYCDEARVWRLIGPSVYEAPGYVVVQSGHNATEGTDSISRNTDEWATGVLVVYRWTEPDGTRQEAYDVAGTASKVLTVERDSEYPGPGAAAYILNSLTGRGRVQDVTALVNFDATPAQDVTINLPGTLTQTGKVRRVVFGLKTGLMELGTRGLIDALPGSWATWDPDETWSEVTPTLKWKDA